MPSPLGLRFFRIISQRRGASALNTPTFTAPTLITPAPTRAASARVAFARRFPIRKHAQQRRFQSTEAPAGSTQSAFQRLWNSPVGAKTVHFWAPVMKWALVLAGVSDFWRPAENLSLTQNLALTATGLIWTRWCFVIKPKNMLLAAVNFFLACVGITQLSRILLYQRGLKNGDLSAVVKEDARDLKDSATGVVAETKGAAREAIN